MLKSIEIRNYKSIEKATLPLGRINVLIGENGAGKSNILEAIALAGAASAGKLDNEFLASRGIRVTQPQLMRAAFEEGKENDPINVLIGDGGSHSIAYDLTNDNAPYSQWEVHLSSGNLAANFGHIINVTLAQKTMRERVMLDVILEAFVESTKGLSVDDVKIEGVDWVFKDDGVELEFATDEAKEFSVASRNLSDFIVYSPENTSLRMFAREGQIEPLGINGEGLLKLLTVLSAPEYESALAAIKEGLKLFGWFEDFNTIPEQGGMPGGMTITDRYLATGQKSFDQKSTNEGFLFLAFYFALFSTDLTPKFFAIDNVDASLNPKLCERLISYLTKLAVQHDKQVILTTHNPAVLDGLNLDDDDQRLFVVSRGPKGQTKLKRFVKPSAREGAEPIRLSEAFLRGSLGGVPTRF